VTRSHIRVRAASEADLAVDPEATHPAGAPAPVTAAALAPFWQLLTDGGYLGTRLAARAEAEPVELLRQLVNTPDVRVMLAWIGEQLAGMAILRATHDGPLADADDGAGRCLQIDHAIVLEEFRRRGVGRALVAAAATYAEEIGAEHVSVDVAPLSREANRFFAQLGLAPQAVRRVAPATALRRRLLLLDRPAGAVRVVPRRALARAGMPGMRTALRRIAVASAVAERPREL
jgi:ribosomal protein S18 acetylase RimI-like enzyme